MKLFGKSLEENITLKRLKFKIKEEIMNEAKELGFPTVKISSGSSTNCSNCPKNGGGYLCIIQ